MRSVYPTASLLFLLFLKSSVLHKFMFMNVCSSSFIELISSPISPLPNLFHLPTFCVMCTSCPWSSWNGVSHILTILKFIFTSPSFTLLSFALYRDDLFLGPLSSTTSCCFSSFLYWGSTSERFFFADTKMRVL